MTISYLNPTVVWIREHSVQGNKVVGKLGSWNFGDKSGREAMWKPSVILWFLNC